MWSSAEAAISRYRWIQEILSMSAWECEDILGGDHTAVQSRYGWRVHSNKDPPGEEWWRVNVQSVLKFSPSYLFNFKHCTLHYWCESFSCRCIRRIRWCSSWAPRTIKQMNFNADKQIYMYICRGQRGNGWIWMRRCIQWESHILACILMSECRAAATPGLSLPSVVTSAIVGGGLQCQDIYQTEGPPHAGPTVRPLDATQPLRFNLPVVFLFSFYLQRLQHNLSLTGNFLLHLGLNIVKIFAFKLDFFKKDKSQFVRQLPHSISQLIDTTKGIN